MVIYFTEAKEIDPEASAVLRRSGHTVLESESEALAQAGVVEALFVRTYTQVGKELLDTYPKVKFVLRAGVGLDNVDVEECKKRGIEVLNSPGANAHAVAEYVVGAAISVLRSFNDQSGALRAGGWRERAYLGSELRGKTLGLVGCGNVGSLIARKLSQWELKEIVGYDPFLSAEQLSAAGIRKSELDEVLQHSDIVSLHLPLTPETKHRIGERELALMKPDALLINAARGGVVDEAALVKALQEGRLAGAVADVFENEPTIAPGLLTCRNILLTPHIAGYTHEADKEVSLAPVRELIRRI